jgi:hypothetical protein
MKRKANKKAAKKKRTVAKPRNPMARALESALFKPKVVPAAKDEPYRRRAKHPKPLTPDSDQE